MTRVIYYYFLLESLFPLLLSVLCTCSTFFLDIRLYDVTYPPYKHTTFPLSLHLYNNDKTDFIHLWTRTYSPTKIASIVTSGNVPYFSASDVMVLLYFLKTQNVSGYIMTLVVMEECYDHQFSFRPPITRICHKLQRLLYFTHCNGYEEVVPGGVVCSDGLASEGVWSAWSFR